MLQTNFLEEIPDLTRQDLGHLPAFRIDAAIQNMWRRTSSLVRKETISERHPLHVELSRLVNIQTIPDKQQFLKKHPSVKHLLEVGFGFQPKLKWQPDKATADFLRRKCIAAARNDRDWETAVCPE